MELMKRIFGFFYKETSVLQEAAYLLAFFSILSQVFAFFRDRLLAYTFGAGSELDMYYAAFRIPDFLFVTVASIVSISVIVPFIVEREHIGREAVRTFIDSIASFFSILIIAISIAAFFAIPIFSETLFRGFSGAELSKVILLSRIFLLSPILLGFSNLIGALTQAYNRFLVYAFAPVMYNVGIILGTLVLAPHVGIYGVAWGVVIGAALHLLIQIPYVVKLGLMPRFKLFFNFESIRRVIGLSLPRTLTLSTNHIATIFLISFASLMATGSISIFSFSLNISSVPLSIIGVSYSLAAFPTLSRYISKKNTEAFVKEMATTTRLIVFWSLPATALFVVLRNQIVQVLLGTGRFDLNDTRLTAAALGLFSLSILFQCLLLLFVRAFYAAGHTRKPFLINLVSTALLLGITYGFVHVAGQFPGFQTFVARVFGVDDLPSTAILMLPLGYSVGTIINGLVHWVGFEIDYPGFTRQTGKTIIQSIVAGIVVGIITHATLGVYGGWYEPMTIIGVFLKGLISGLVGIAAGLGVLALMKSKDLRDIRQGISRKFFKKGIVAEDPKIV